MKEQEFKKSCEKCSQRKSMEAIEFCKKYEKEITENLMLKCKKEAKEDMTKMIEEQEKQISRLEKDYTGEYRAGREPY